MYVSQHSKAAVVVVEDNKQLQKYANRTDRSSLPALKALVVWGEAVDPKIAAQCAGVTVYSWSDFLALGAAVADAAVEARGKAVRPGNCSTLIYTSGTTGMPKAVMISHDNITWTASTMCTRCMIVSVYVLPVCVCQLFGVCCRFCVVLPRVPLCVCACVCPCGLVSLVFTASALVTSPRTPSHLPSSLTLLPHAPAAPPPTPLSPPYPKATTLTAE